MKTPKELAEEIMAYAQAHYNDGAWDCMVECETVPEIEEEIEELGYTTFEEVFDFYSEVGEVLDEERAWAKVFREEAI